MLEYSFGRFNYTGELDDKGKATGKGKAVSVKRNEDDQNNSDSSDELFVVSWEGTFMNG